MNQDSEFFYSHNKTFENCPRMFLWSYGWDGIDLGYGDGKPRPKMDDSSRHHAVMGTVIQAVIEKMYNDELWRDPLELKQNLLDLVEPLFNREASKKKNVIHYDRARVTKEDLLKICKDGVAGFLKTMRKHRLLGPYAKAEVHLGGWLNKWSRVGGIADVVIRRDDTGVTILDGKNTKNRVEGADPDQLLWYALMYRLTYKEMPNRLGFVWYRFPYTPATEDQPEEPGLDWVPFTLDQLKALGERFLLNREAMRKSKFDPTPSPSTCRFCPFREVCPERIAQKEERSRKVLVEGISAGSFSDLALD